MLIASMMMLVAMTFASCKSSNKPAAEEARTLGEVPEVLKDVAGLEMYETKLDYSKDECWLERPAEAKKAVDVFYIYPTVTGFREPVQICEITDSELVAGAKMVREVQTSVFDESCNVYMPTTVRYRCRSQAAAIPTSSTSSLVLTLPMRSTIS